MARNSILGLVILINMMGACSNAAQKTDEKSSLKEDKKTTKENKPVTALDSSTASAGKASDCNEALWKNVYDPDRLQVLEKCKTVTGVIEESNADPDGDQHMLLKLDKGQKDLINKRNKKKKEGDLVIEVVCANNITRKRAMGACTGYTNNISLPSVGEHVRVSGTYVLDSHNGWTEIHPVSRIEKMN
jgi:hypothetical protein